MLMLMIVLLIILKSKIKLAAPWLFKALSAAAAEGDRSENAEHIYRKKELHGLDRWIRYLQKIMPDLRVISDKADTTKIFFAAIDTLENEQK